MKWTFLLAALTAITYLNTAKADVYQTISARQPVGLISISTEPCGLVTTQWVARLIIDKDIVNGCWHKVGQKVVIKTKDKTYEFDANVSDLAKSFENGVERNQ